MANVLRNLRKRVAQLILPKGGRWLPAIVAIVCLLSPVAALGANDAPSAIEIRSHGFANGLVLYHASVEQATTFTLSTTVWVGSVDENPKDNAGVSHLLEHLLFHQPGISEIEFFDQVRSRGGFLNAMTSRFHTAYYVTLPSRDLSLGQTWLHQVLFHDQLTTERLADEKAIINRENGWSNPTWWDRILGLIRPDYLVLPGPWELFWGRPAYDQGPGGRYRTASKLSANQLEAYYRKHYYPENMALLYVGPHRLEEVVGLLEGTFGKAARSGKKPRAYPAVFDDLPSAFYAHQLRSSGSDYEIAIGHLFSAARPHDQHVFQLYRFVLRELLLDRFRYNMANTYSVSTSSQWLGGTGWLVFSLEASPETYWEQVRAVREIVWGDLERHLSQAVYERYRKMLLERVVSTRDVMAVHAWTWETLFEPSLHPPTPAEVSLTKTLESLSYQEFLAWSRVWRRTTAPVLELSMPPVPFPHADLVLYVLGIGLGLHLASSPLRRSQPREKVRFVTEVPFGVPGWCQLGLLGALAACGHYHVGWLISESTISFSDSYALAMALPYAAAGANGLLLGLALVLGGLLLPRKVLVTDRALVLKTRSPLFFRIPFQDIEGVEPVHGWQALRKILSLHALPFQLWFCRGLLIHRKSGPAWVIHTTHDTYLRALVSWHAERARAVPKVRGAVEFQTQALAPCQTGPLGFPG